METQKEEEEIKIIDIKEIKDPIHLLELKDLTYELFSKVYKGK
jgi:hypothetical protein